MVIDLNKSRVQQELWVKGSFLIAEKRFSDAEATLFSAIEAIDDNPIDRHFTYNQLIELYYKMRNEWKGALDKCIKYCLEDIDRLPEFFEYEKKAELASWRESKDINERLGYETHEFSYHPPRCPSLSRLTIIFEKRGEYKKAIEICDKAILLEQNDGTKYGFEGRKTRLQKK